MQVLLANVRKDLRDPKIHAQFDLYVLPLLHLLFFFFFSLSLFLGERNGGGRGLCERWRRTLLTKWEMIAMSRMARNPLMPRID